MRKQVGGWVAGWLGGRVAGWLAGWLGGWVGKWLACPLTLVIAQEGVPSACRALFPLTPPALN